MYQVIIVIHVLLGLGIIGLILIQQGKGADAGATFGAGASGSVFGAQGAASFLSRTTATLAALFFITSLGLAILNGKQGAAYDLMNAPATEAPVGIPGTDAQKTAESVAVAPNAKPEELPAIPPASTAEQPVDQAKPQLSTEAVKKETKPGEAKDKVLSEPAKQTEKK
ncbi:MAG: preprotein translocase subunit SecG [Methylovulum sp.]|nr:MAG: preprotein translocase subunit SecG [Methylovulum sp.]